MDYKPLKIVKFINKGDTTQEYLKRYDGFGTIKTQLFPHLIKRNEFASNQFELFSVPLNDIQLLTQNIHNNSKHILELAEQLPGVARQQFYNEQLYKAVISTDEIEGIRTTRKEVSIAHKSLFQKTKENIRLQSTVRLYNDIRENNLLTIDNLETIRSIYEQLTEGEIDDEDILDGELFRNNTVSVIDSNTNKVEHIPPSTEQQISTMLRSWIRFINDHSVPVLIKSFLAHYFFENIHPFYDGNGRTGRYILARYLARKLDLYSALVMSQQINQEKKKYYEAFKITGDVDNKAEGTFFVLSMMEILQRGQQEIITILQEKNTILEDYSLYLEQAHYSELQRGILFLLLQSKVFVDDPSEGISDNEIIQVLSKHFPKFTIKREIDALEAAGTIQLTSQRPKKHMLT